MTLVGMARRRWWVGHAARTAAYAGGVLSTASVVAAGVLWGQARQVRREIPLADAPPPRCDGVWGSRMGGRPIRVALLGDSCAAGYGVRRTRETPGALLATGVSRRLRRPVELHRLAVVGADSSRLHPQVDAALDLDCDLAIILVGANDVTHRASQVAAVQHLVAAVRRLRAAGTEVVVGTCPDLGAIVPIKPPLRWLARRWSRQLAAAQTIAVVEAGGRTVSLGDLLGPRFAAEPHRMFSWDRFHPSAAGYASAVSALLPTVLSALGEREESGPRPALGEGVTTLPWAAHQAVKVGGTEVSGTEVAGRERGPAGRWALLRRRPAWLSTPPAGEPQTPPPTGGTPSPPGPSTRSGSTPSSGRLSKARALTLVAGSRTRRPRPSGGSRSIVEHS